MQSLNYAMPVPLTRGPRGGAIGTNDATDVLPDISFLSGRVRLSADLDDQIVHLEADLRRRDAETAIVIRERT